MKKIIFSLAFALLSLSAFALNLENFSLSVEPLFGMKWGQIDEYVFFNNCAYDDDKLSELNWEIKPEFYYGLKISGGWKDFFGESYFSAGIPKETGLMIDSDWLNVSVSNAQDYQYKTNYSESDNRLDYDINFGFKGGYDFQIKDFINIKPALAFDYSNIKFTASGGTGWYGKSASIDGRYYAPYSDTENRDVHNFSGRVITYKRIAYTFWLGSDFSIALPLPDFLTGDSQSLSLNTGFFISPYVYAVSFDAHLSRKSDFADLTVDYFSAFKWNLGLTYEFNSRHSLSINANYFYMKVLRGDDYEKTSSDTNYTKSTYADGGAGAKYFDINLSYKFKIF